MLFFKNKSTLITLLGNTLEHYDKALYGLIAPFIASLFYPKFHPLTALILAYLPVNFIFRPLGALFFGYLSDRFDRKKVLCISILGMSLMMVCVGLIPVYRNIGIASAFILHFLRGMICFFAAGEGTAAALLLIEKAKPKHRDLMSSLYEMSSMAGPLIASVIITYLTCQGSIVIYWRWLFIMSGILGIILFWARQTAYVPSKTPSTSTLLPTLQIKESLLPFLAVIFVTGFSCANYNILSALMNGYIPLISKFSYAQMMLIHSWLICGDFLLLPVFGFLARRFGKEKMIFTALFGAFIFVIPLFSLLGHPSFFNVLLLRMILVTWGTMLAAPYEHWMISLFEEKKRFRLMALAKAIGSEAIGAPAVSMSLWIYQKTNWVIAPSLYILICTGISILFLGFLYWNKAKNFIFSNPKITDHRAS